MGHLAGFRPKLADGRSDPYSLVPIASVTAIVMMGLLSAMPICHGDRINALMVGSVWGNTLLEKYFDEEPLMKYATVPCREGGGLAMSELVKAIRLYFPRTYEDMLDFDYLMLLAPEFYLLNPKQDLWMHDMIEAGAGGFNDGSVFSISGPIHESWSISLTQRAFPNDAPAVVLRGGGGVSPSSIYGVVINRDFPDPVLTPYIDYGVENVPARTSRFIIPRETAGIMAWQVGNFPAQGRVPFLVSWDYGEGRAISCGGFIKSGETWLGKENPYGPDIVINMILYSTQKQLIQDVDVFHRLKLGFREFNDRMNMLIALVDFVDAFGANTQKIQSVILDLEDMRRKAGEEYLNQDFTACSITLDGSFLRFGEAEAIAKETKRAALLWVYVIEWLVTTTTLLLTSFVLWSLMVRRRLYRQVVTTRFDTSPDE
jgi:hypothetical protein